MKRTLCLLLCAALLATPAAAASESSTTDQRLSQVTQTVKNILQLDNSYTSFHGELQEDPLRTLWRLEWTTDDQSTLSVTADEDGTIYRYQYTPASTDSQSSPRLPAFPSVSRQTAQQTAQNFANTVLQGYESVDLSQSDDTPILATSHTHSFSADLQLYGLPSPIALNVAVDGDTGTLLRYSRTDSYTTYVGTPVDPASLGLSADQAQNAQAYDKATALLGDETTLLLEYALNDDGKTASLRYLPASTDDWYVDAKTGQLTNLTQTTRALYDKYGGAIGSTGSADAAAESSANSGLSDAEQAGIAQMEGVLDKQTLDSKMRSWPELGLTGYNLATCSYAIDAESGTVYANMRYTRTEGNNLRHQRIQVNAKTGEIENIYGSSWIEAGFTPKYTLKDAQAIAESFLSRLWPDQHKTCALYESTEADPDSDTAEHVFFYSQKVNGYFFPRNNITISVNALTGAVTYLTRSFDAQPAFDSADGLISAEAAHAAWMDTFDTRLGYLEVPEEASASTEGAQLAEMGYPFVDRLTLAFYLEQPTRMQGIDAKTGQPIAWQSGGQDITYSDLSSTWAASAAQALALYDVGWLGGTLQPTKPLTQLELMALLCSVDGYLVDLSEEDAADQIYDYATSSGMLSRSAREDDRLITRAELVKVILDNGGYGDAAQIPGIFRCTFSDAQDIPETYYGYAAIAQGLHMVSGDEAGRFAAGQTATREEAISMLYQFMAR